MAIQDLPPTYHSGFLFDSLSAMDWTVYIVEAGDGSLYTGITTDVERRIKEHESGGAGAKYLKGRNPLTVVYTEAGHDRSSAAKREAEIKKLSRGQKQALINSN